MLVSNIIIHIIIIIIIIRRVVVDVVSAKTMRQEIAIKMLDKASL